MALRNRLVASLVLAVAGTLALSACGASSDASNVSTPSDTAGNGDSASPTNSIGALLPEAIRSAGVLRVGSDMTYAPFEFLADDKTPQGFDVELINAVGEELGIKIELVNTSFDSIIPGLLAKKYDAIISALTDNEDRRKQVDFVDYITVGAGLLVPQGNPKGITGVEDLCGRKVAIAKGSTQVADADEESKKCTDSGKPEIEQLIFPAQPEVMLALTNGRADAALTDLATGAYNIQQTGQKLEFVGAPYRAVVDGIAIPKNDTELAKALQAAVQAVMDGGEYDSMLEKWGLTAGSMTKATINLQ